jgi:Fe-Mn family superoxide dismutase
LESGFCWYWENARRRLGHCNQNPANGRLSNHWITLHETGNVAGFNPILVMDVWEHAFLLDYKPAERPKYIEAFFSNINWNESREEIENQHRKTSPGLKLFWSLVSSPWTNMS